MTPTAPKAKVATVAPTTNAANAGMLVIVRVRAHNRMSAADEYALDMLKLPVPNSCCILPDTPQTRGMITRSMGVLTWGEASDESIALLAKKAKDTGAVAFRLNPPRKGYGRKGIKIPFVAGGALGNRGIKINDLIKRMVD